MQPKFFELPGCNVRKIRLSQTFQGQILAVWILATKLPNSNLNFAVDFWVDFLLLFFQGKGPKTSTEKSPAKFTSLTLQSLLVSISLFFSFSDFPCFLVRFPFFSQDFRGSAKRKPLAFFRGFPCFSPKKQGVEGQGWDFVRKYSPRMSAETFSWKPPAKFTKLANIRQNYLNLALPCEGFIRHSPSQTPPSNPPRPPLVRGRFGIDLTSIRHRFDIAMSNRCRINVKSTPDEGRVRRIRGWGLGGPVPNKPLTSLALRGAEPCLPSPMWRGSHRKGLTCA